MVKLSPQFYYKKNRLQQLKGFYHTAQCNSFSKAAEKMGLTQSTITLQLQSLERDLGIKLLDRNAKKVELTKEGKMFYSYAVPYIQGMDNLFENFKEDLKKFDSAIVDIAANHVSISYILPRYIKKFKDIHSDVRFKIRNLAKEDAIKKLINDEVDMFLYPMPQNGIPAECDFIPLAEYHPILLVKKNHPLATKKSITLADISPYELVRIDPKFIVLPAFEEAVRLYKFKVTMELEVFDWEILKKFVRADIGIAIISDMALEDGWEKEFVIRDLTNYFPKMMYGILVKKRKIATGLVKEFLELFTSEKLFTTNL